MNESIKKANRADSKLYALLKYIYKRIIYVILSVVLLALMGFGACKLFTKPTYTASQSVILSMDASVNDQSLNVSLAKVYLPTIEKILKSKKIIDAANELYTGEGDLTAGSVGLSRNGEESLIFKITYTDVDATTAQNKLSALLQSAKQEVHKVVSGGVKFVETDRERDVATNTSTVKWTLIGAGIGGVVSVVVILLIYFTDTSVKDKDELSELTKTSVLATISKI